MSTDQTILSASGFVNSIGVNTHAGFAWNDYNNLALMVDDLKYLGVTHLRDAMASSPAAQPVVDGLAAAGYTFDFLVSSALPGTGSAGLQAYIVSLDNFIASHPGSISAIEGLNEANIQPFSYNGSSSLSAAAQFQGILYESVKADAALASIPVYNLSLGYNDPQGYNELGNMSASTDYANAHAYVPSGSTPNGSLATTLSVVESAAPGKPVVITETGYTTQADTQYLGVDETVQAKSILNTLVDAYKGGVSSTYLYELFDRDSSAGNTNPEAKFGLFHSDGTPKLAATAIHNLTTILADDGTGTSQPTAPLNYTLSNMPDSGNSMVLGKSNGTYDLVVWAEPTLWNSATDSELSNPTNSVTVNLGAVHHSVNVYDTLSGTSPIASYADVSTITLPISDHPLVIEIDAPPTTTVPPTAPSVVSGTAAEIVPQLSELNDSSALQSITLTDTHVLPVASQATMDYIISHYSKALATIQGGYSFSVTTSAPGWTNTQTYDSTGTLLSTSDTGLSGSLPMSTTILYADGSTDLIGYAGGVKTTFIHVAADGTRTTDNYDSSGNLINEVLQRPDGYYATTVYTNGVKTAAYVLNADHTQDNYSYNITGQTFTTQVQHLDATGKVTAVTRTHADGSLDSTQVINDDGSSAITLYDATGVKLVETDFHADQSRDVYTYNIAGQSYTTEHDTYDPTGFLTALVRNHADGSLAFTLHQSTDGTKATDWYDDAGNLTSEILQRADGYASTTVYSNGVATNAYITNADHSQDNYSYNITGQSYTTEHQHLDASGHVTAVTRTHADGSLDYTQVINGDGSSVVANYDTSGVKTTETDLHADGSKDVLLYNIAGQNYTTEHDGYDASGTLTSVIRSHADNSLAFAWSQSGDGTQTTDWYDPTGNLTSEAVQRTDGYSSTTLYSNGVKTAAYITNPDHSSDNWSYNITGQTYTTQHQHLDASGNVVSIERTHADGTLDYSQVNNPDGSKLTDIYDSTGTKTQETANNADGTKDVFLFNFNGQAGMVQHERYDTAGALQFFDDMKGDGTHNVTAVAAGVTIQGGAGDDVLSTAPGSTTVVYDHGHDQVFNFHAGDAVNHDTIEISKLLAADYSHLQMAQWGTDVAITLSANDSILIKNTYVASLTSHDFQFV